MISYKELYSIISGRSSILRPEYVGKELSNCHERLSKCLDGFLPPSSSSHDKVKTSNDVKRKEFVYQLSKTLNLDEWQSHILFQQYLSTDFHGSARQLQAIFNDHLQTELFLQKLLQYYFDERLLLLHSIKYILALWQNEKCLFREQFSSAVDYLAGKSFPDVIFKQYQSVLETSCLHDGIAGSAVLQAAHVKQGVLEQQALLEILLLYYKDFEISAANLLKFAKYLQGCEFGQRQTNRTMFDRSCQQIVENTGYLCCLLLLEGLDLEVLRAAACIDQHSVVKDAEHRQKLEDLCLYLGGSPHHGPFLLAMSMFEIEADEDSTKKASRYSQAALRCGVFQQLLAMTTGLSGSVHEVVESICKSIVYSQLKLLFNSFEETSFENPMELLSLLCTVLKNDIRVSKDFLTSEQGIAQLLQFGMKLFPYHMMPLLELCNSLCNDDETSAAVYEIMDSLRSYTELFGKNAIDDITMGDDPSVWIRLAERELTADGLLLPKGTVGLVTEITGDVKLIQWRLDCSGWKVLLNEVSSYVSEPALYGSDGAEKLCGIFKLVKATLSFQNEDDLDQFVVCCLQIIRRVQLFLCDGLKLVSSCFALLTAVLPLAPTVVWDQLLQCHFVPFADSANEVDAASGNYNDGALGTLLLPVRTVQGAQTLINEYLSFILELLRRFTQSDGVTLTKQQEVDLFVNVHFVVAKVFPQLMTSSFTAGIEQDDTHETALSMFHLLLTLPQDTLNGSISIFRSIESMLLDELHNKKPGGALLSLASIGMATVEDWNRAKIQNTVSTENSLHSTLKYSLSLLYQLALKRQKGDGASALEEAICHSVISNHRDAIANQGLDSTSFMTVISRYIHCHDDTKLATLATLLLQQFCRLFPMALSSAFGNEVEALRNTLENCLSSRVKPIRLKVAVLEFLTMALDTQPGLSETFLSIAKLSEGKEEIYFGKRSCLHPIFEFVNAKGKSAYSHPDVVVAGALQFLSALWNLQQGDVLAAIRKQEWFWKGTTLPLETCSNDDLTPDQVDMVASSLLLVSHEMFRVRSDKFDAHLMSCLQSSISLKLFSTVTKLCYVSPSTLDDSPKGRKALNSKVHIAKSWLTFLVVGARLQPEKCLLVSKTNQSAVVHYLLELFSNWMTSMSLIPLDAIEELASTINVLVCRWKTALVGVEEIWKKSVTAVLTISAYDLQICERIIVPSFSFCLALAESTAERCGALPWSSVSAIQPFTCQVLLSFANALGATEKDGSQHSASDVVVLSLSLLDELASCCGDCPGYLEILQEYAIIPVLIKLVSYGLQKPELQNVIHTVFQYLLQLAEHVKPGQCLISSGLHELLCLEISPSMLCVDPASASLDGVGCDIRKRHLWKISVQITTSLLRQLRHEALSLALDFLGSHKESLLDALQVIKRLSSEFLVNETLAVCVFLKEIFHYNQELSYSLPSVMIVFQNEIAKICQTCVALLSKKRLLNYLVECPYNENANVAIARSRTPPSPALKDVSSKCDDEVTSSHCSAIQKILLRVLGCSTAVLTSLTPSVVNILSHQGYDLDGVSPLLELSFTYPSLDESAVSCFGTIIASIHLCFKMLQKNNVVDLSNHSPAEKISSTPLDNSLTPLPLEVPAHQLIVIIETSLALILSQASLYLRHENVETQAKQLLRRELGSELRHFLHLYSRRLARHPSMLSPPPSTEKRTSAGVQYKRSPSKLGPLFSDDDENSIFKITDVFSKQLLQ